MFVGAWADLERPPLLAALRAADVAPDGTRRSPSTRTRNRKAWATLQGYADDLGFGPAVLKARDLKGAGFGQRTAIFAPAEWAALLAATACPRATLAFEGLRWSGMRPGELCTAEMRHLTESGGVPAIVLTEHKTAAKTGEDRVIPVVAALAPVLARAVDGRDAGPIWRDPAGGPWNPDRLNWAFRKARRAAALPAALKLYSTRHTRGTELVAEVGEIAAAAILGREGVAMTSVRPPRRLRPRRGRGEDRRPRRGRVRPHADGSGDLNRAPHDLSASPSRRRAGGVLQSRRARSDSGGGADAPWRSPVAGQTRLEVAVRIRRGQFAATTIRVRPDVGRQRPVRIPGSGVRIVEGHALMVPPHGSYRPGRPPAATMSSCEPTGPAA